MNRPPFQHRHQIYVLGANQDSRLASLAAGASATELTLQTDGDAPFICTWRALRCKYDASLTQAPLQGLKSRWAGPQRDYKLADYILESLYQVYFGQNGCPKPISPGVVYPANSTIQVDSLNTGASAITNLTYYFGGYKLFPWDAVTGYAYPKKFKTQTFSYPVFVSALGVSETRLNLPFTVKPDAAFVWRAGQGIKLSNAGGRTIAEVAIQFMDHQKKPFSNDFVHFDIYFGNGNALATIPLGPTPSFVSPFGTGPGQPGLLYPEFYTPKNQQFLYSLQRSDGSGGSNQAEDFTFNLIGAKVFE